MSGLLLAWPPGTHAAPHCFSRPFASECADLDVLVDSSAAGAAAGDITVPAVITRLLSGCLRDAEGVAPAPEDAWRWSVARRRQGLIAIANATLGGTVKALARCTAQECRNQIELDLGLVSFADEPREHVELDVDGRRAVCRMATGADLLDWAREGNFDAAWLAARLLLTLDGAPKSDDWSLGGSELDALAAAFEAADPLAALSVPVHCPCCGIGLDVTLDLETLLLGALREVARETLEDVHRLARAYHWSETEIVAMPRERRRAYLARLQREGA